MRTPHSLLGTILVLIDGSAFVPASNIKASGFRKMGSLTFPLSPLFSVALELSTFLHLRSTPTPPTCNALLSSSPSSPSLLSVSFSPLIIPGTWTDRGRLFCCSLSCARKSFARAG